ncbi:LytR/AlgR family response regulator transcription factor [Pedobacter sp. AW31-3R]|uniref:LytR/AlgR family response regulator transcription factor n=1 Tax=Pedobacter sp. AW31-3R TaxID=3445781 RepID=UPI003FA07D6E
MKVIIIEDELRTAKELKGILEKLDSEITIFPILSSVAGAISWFRNNPAPDLIFSDIQLGDGLSFEIFKEVPLTIPIIFCTAFDEYAIHAFESNSVDYLLKPLEETMVERSLLKYHRIKDYYASGTYTTNFNKVMVQMEVSYKQTLLIYYREKIIPVKVVDICYIYAAAGLVTLRTLSNQDYTLPYTIDQMENMLNPQSFFRVNRQFIINRESVQNIEHYFNRRLFVKLPCETPIKIIVSRLKVQDFLAWIEQ